MTAERRPRDVFTLPFPGRRALDAAAEDIEEKDADAIAQEARA